MADSDETKVAVEYWDRVAASAKRGTNAQTVDGNLANAETAERIPDRAEEREERNSTARRSRQR
ncbi:MAG TPA: hypothetical protein VGR45_10240 [Stellaceae bacterium]|nr:hypothetical protein [Stellaceae bacterium]